MQSNQCQISEVSSRVCEKGTKCCTVNHTFTLSEVRKNASWLSSYHLKDTIYDRGYRMAIGDLAYSLERIGISTEDVEACAETLHDRRRLLAREHGGEASFDVEYEDLPEQIKEVDRKLAQAVLLKFLSL